MNVRVRLLSLFGIVLTVFAANPSHAALVISEFLAENDGGLHDSDGDSPDWIEIQNTGPGVAALLGWHLTDTPTNLVRWTFPATNLAPGSFLVVFASGKDRAISGPGVAHQFSAPELGPIPGARRARRRDGGLLFRQLSQPASERWLRHRQLARTTPPYFADGRAQIHRAEEQHGRNGLDGADVLRIPPGRTPLTGWVLTLPRAPARWCWRWTLMSGADRR